MKAMLWICCALALAVVRAAFADVVTLNGGTTIDGTVVQKDEKEVLLLRDFGTQWIPAPMVKTIKIDPQSHPKTLGEKNVNPSFLPAWGQIVAEAARSGWGGNLRQIPATVIDKGVLKSVPYVSFRCGKEYELNIYGDLDNPAGVEVGTYGSLIGKEHAQKNAVELIASLLPSEPDREILRKLDRAGAKAGRNGVAIEITPPTADDSYSGWWVSIYSEKALQDARASDAELNAITVANNSTINTNAISPWLAGLRAAAPATLPAAATGPSLGTYSGASDGYSGLLDYVVPSQRAGGRVFVNGYTRQDGAYVHSYSRSAPR